MPRSIRRTAPGCHGATGEGGIGPVLNDQAKLLTHLTPQYLATVLTVGGRYVCGDPELLMLAWLEPKGPLNYRQVEELVAFIRAPSTLTYSVEDHETGGRSRSTPAGGTRAMRCPPGATPVPDCWKDAFGGGGGTATPAPSGAPTAAPSDGGSGGETVTIKITASGIAFDTDSLEVPANTPFQIVFTNNDAGIPHNVAIHEGSPTGPAVWTGEIFNGVETRTYDVPALPAGAYGFVCTVHPNMTGTLTAK